MRTHKAPTVEQLEACDRSFRGRCPNIHALAAFINASGLFTATVSKRDSTKERRTPGCRYVSARWEVEGNYLEVREIPAAGGYARPVFSHNTADTYAENRTVVRWILANIVRRG